MPIASTARHQAGTGECATKRTSRRILSGMPTDQLVFTHAECVCNEVMALSNRHQAPAPPARREWRELLVAPGMDGQVEPWSRKKVVAHYDGGKRSRYDNARISLESEHLTERDGNIRMFLKADKYHFDEDVRIKAPRCIQFRRERYGLELGRFVHAIEEELYPTTLDCSETPVFAKCRNFEQRASDLLAKSKVFADPVYLLLDQTNWDSHVNSTLLEYEHQLYLSKCPNKYFAFLLNMQKHNKGGTRNGTRFSTKATRMSGDMNTALGNCVVNYGLLYTWAKEAKLRCCFYIDGDDSVVVMEKTDMEKARLLDPATWFLNWGMESKVEWAYQFEHCEFCQCRPVFDGLAYRMVRNPERFCIRSGWTVNPHPEAFFPKLVASIAKCEMATHPGIPVVFPLAAKMLEASGLRPDMKVWRGLDSYQRAKHEAWAPDRAHLISRPITMESRLSLEAAWSIPVLKQLEMEASELRLAHTSPEDWATYLLHFAGDNHVGL